MDSFFDKAKRIVSVLAILGLIVAPLPSTEQVQKAVAGDITYPSGYITFGSSTPGATTSVTIKFTVATAHQANSNFHIQLWTAAGDAFNLASATIGTGGTSGLSPVQSHTGFNMTEVTVSTANAIAAGTTVTIPFNNVKLPSSSGSMNIYSERFGQQIDGVPGSPDKGVPFELGDSIISGTVTLSTGAAVSGARVELHNFNGTFGSRTQTKSDGTYKITGDKAKAQTAGELWFEVRVDNDPSIQQSEPERVTFTGTALTKNVTLKKGDRTLKGKVALEDGTGLCNAMVNGFGERGKGWFAIQTDKDGNYATSALGSGKYRVMVFRMLGGPNCPQSGPPPQPGQPPKDTGPKWAFTGRPFLVDLENNTTLTKNITVQKATATLKVTVEAPTGVDLSRAGGFLELNSGTFHQGEPIFTSGSTATVTFNVVPGAYNIRYFGRPPMPGETGVKLLRIGNKQDVSGIVVNENETVSATAKLTDSATAGAKVKVKTVDKDTNTAISGQFVIAFSGGPGGGPGEDFTPPSFGQTGADGTATLNVSAGRGMVMSMGSDFKVEGHAGGEGGAAPGGGEKHFSILAASEVYVPDSGPKPYNVDADKTVDITFPMAKAASTINVTVLKKADSSPASGLFGFIPILKKGGGFAGGAPLSSQGTAQIRVPNGTFIVGLGTPPGENLFSEKEEEVAVTNETKAVTLNVVKGNATVKVNLVDSKGAAVDVFGAEVPIFSGGAFAPAHIEGGSGSASVFGDGSRKWTVGTPHFYEFGVGGETNYVPVAKGSNTVTPKAGETVTVTYELLEKNATLSGEVKEEGTDTPLPGVTVTADNLKTKESGQVADDFDFGRRFVEDAKTNKDGKFTLKVVPSDTVKVFASLPAEKGYAPTESQSVKAEANKVTTVPKVKMKKYNASVDVTATGSDGKALAGASVTAFNKDGAISTGTTGSDGKATISVTNNEDWQFVVAKDKNETDYSHSPINKVTLGANDAKGSVSLSTQDYKDALPAGTTTQASSSSTLTLNSSEKDGDHRATVTAPAQAFSSTSSENGQVSENTIQATIKPTDEAPRDEKNFVVGVQYEMSFSDTSGQEVQPSSELSGKFTVKKEEMDRAGVTASQLTVQHYDETKGTWTSDGDGTGTKTTLANGDVEVVFTTNHASTFAVVAAADTTAPAEVKDPKATAGDTKVTLSWTNPTDSDFNGVEVYRSEDTKSIGSKVKTTAKADTSYEDTGLTNGKVYYYTFKSVDATGNVSAGTDQVSATPSTTAAAEAAAAKTLPKTGALVHSPLSTVNGWYALVGLVMAGIGALVVRRKGLNG